MAYDKRRKGYLVQVKPKTLAFFLKAAIGIKESSRREFRVTDSDVKRSGEVLESKGMWFQQRAVEVFLSSGGDKAKTARHILDEHEGLEL